MDPCCSFVQKCFISWVLNSIKTFLKLWIPYGMNLFDLQLSSDIFLSEWNEFNLFKHAYSHPNELIALSWSALEMTALNPASLSRGMNPWIQPGITDEVHGFTLSFLKISSKNQSNCAGGMYSQIFAELCNSFFSLIMSFLSLRSFEFVVVEQSWFLWNSHIRVSQREKSSD